MDLLVDQDSEKYSAVCTYDGTLGGEPFFVPPHWHKVITQMWSWPRTVTNSVHSIMMSTLLSWKVE